MSQVLGRGCFCYTPPTCMKPGASPAHNKGPHPTAVTTSRCLPPPPSSHRFPDGNPAPSMGALPCQGRH